MPHHNPHVEHLHRLVFQDGDLRTAVAGDPVLMEAAQGERERLSAIIAGDRTCHISKKIHAALTEALQTPEAS